MGYIYGLDISKHNGTLDFNAIKNAGNDFVIIRCGYGSASSQKDTRFEEYYKQAKAVGLHVGAYLYGYALNTSGALEEAKMCCEWLKGKQFEMPIYYDMEDADGYKKKHGMPSNSTLSAICETFCDYMEKQGYYVGIYASESWLKNQLTKVVSKNKYDLWCANWGTNDGTLQNKKTSYRMHQFTSEYKLNSKRFDRNVVYDYDYPKVIMDKGLNGFTSVAKPTEPNKPSSPSGNTLDLAYEVMIGNYGSGDQRKQSLGTRYEEVQGFINHIASASVDTLVSQTKAGKYGNGNVRKVVLGDRYNEVQNKINSSAKTIKEGSKIRIKEDAKDVNTRTAFASFVYKNTYYVQNIESDYVVFGPKKTGVATGKVKKTDVIIQ